MLREETVIDSNSGLIPCDGGLTTGRKCGYCENSCAIRPCAVARGVKVCPECPEYPCKTLADFFGYVSEEQADPMKKLLDAIAEVEQNMHTAF